jgi:hypothetical protein
MKAFAAGNADPTIVREASIAAMDALRGTHCNPQFNEWLTGIGEKEQAFHNSVLKTLGLL